MKVKSYINEAIEKLKSNGVDLYSLKVTVDSEIDVSGWLGKADNSDFVDIFSSDISLYTDELFENKIKIGHAVSYYIGGYNWVEDEFVNLMNIADAVSGDLLTSIVSITDENGKILDKFFEGFGVLYIDEFFIKESYRDKGIGSLVFALLLDKIGRDVGAITIIPTPTENDGEIRIKSEDDRYNDILNKMCKFIMKFGFYKVDHENRVWVKNLSLRDD